jgi:hypothetical protein
MKVPSQQQLDDADIDEIWEQMKAERQPKKKSKIGLWLMWLIPLGLWVMLLIVWWRLFA